MYSISKFIITCICAIGLAFYMFMSSNSHSDSEDLLTIGLQSGYPPFEFLNEQGEIVGFDVDVANLIAAKMSKKLVIKDMEFEGLLLALKQNKIDLIISGMNITPSRQKEIDMLAYHGDKATSLSLIFWEHIPEGVASLQDLANLNSAVVSVEVGTIPEAYMTRYPQITIKALQGALAPLMDVKFGKSMANLVEPDVATFLKQKHPQIVTLEVPLEANEKIEGFGIGINKKEQQLKKEVQKVLEELKNSGELQAAENKWFKGGVS